jgi:hypothetical protein
MPSSLSLFHLMCWLDFVLCRKYLHLHVTLLIRVPARHACRLQATCIEQETYPCAGERDFRRISIKRREVYMLLLHTFLR